MRPIKFRGQHIDTKELVYGYYTAKKVNGVECGVIFTQNPNNEDDIGAPQVIPETVCQFTGLIDKNGKEIYENDLVIGNTSFESYNDEFNWTREKPLCVIWDEKEAGFTPFTLGARWRCDVCNIEVIGNQYENPELLN